MEKHLIEKYKHIFIPGIRLNEMFYEEAVRPVMGKFFPDIPCSAALIGSGSDILGFDNPVSVDHDWGPKINLFLKDEDYNKYRDEIDNCLKENLPHEFLGFSVNFSEPDLSDGGTRTMEPKGGGPVNHKIGIFTLKSFFESYLGINPYESMELTDWLTFTEQALLEITGGKVYHDGLNELNKFRKKFSYYPEDIWLYKMACQWQRISQEEPFMGRCGECGDEIGSHIIAARLIRDMMKLSFLMEKKYAPYNKWFGTAFAGLNMGKKLIPVFDKILKGKDWKERENHLCEAYLILAEKHNTLKITEPQEVRISSFFERPYKIILAGRFVEAIKKSIKSEEIKNIKPYIGSVDQYVDSTDLSDSIKLTRILKILYK